MSACTTTGWSRRQFLQAAAAAAAAGLPPTASAVAIYTPHDLAQQFQRQVNPQLRVPAREAHWYGGIAEAELGGHWRQVRAPQYFLMVDSSPQIQAAFLFWRLLSGSHELLGACPVSTGGSGAADQLQTPQGVFEQVPFTEPVTACQPQGSAACGRGVQRVYDFGWQRTRLASGTPAAVPMRLLLRPARREDEPHLGRARSDGCILLPASLVGFLDEYAVLDAAAERLRRHSLPYRGRLLLVVDSERAHRPAWSPAPGGPLAARFQ
jgi:TAT (twin-arginine translocation) pathway signal sequence